MNVTLNAARTGPFTHLFLQPQLGVGNQLRFWCGFPEFHISMLSSPNSFSTSAKARNKVGFMEKIIPHGAVEEQC